MGQRFVDFETKICADWLNAVDDAVFDALGTPQTPDEARQNINAVEEAPNDGNAYVRKTLGWLVASAAMLHNELGGRDAADAHPQTSITGLVTRLSAIESKNTAQDGLITDLQTTKADKTYVDQQNAAQDATIALKAEKTYVDTQDANLQAQITANDGDITNLQNTKADITYVDAQNTAQTAELLGLIIALG